MGFRVRQIQIQILSLLFTYVTLGKLFNFSLRLTFLSCKMGKIISTLQCCQNENNALDAKYQQSYCRYIAALNKCEFLPTSYRKQNLNSNAYMKTHTKNWDHVCVRVCCVGIFLLKGLVHLFFFFFFNLFGRVARRVGSQFLTRDRTHAPCDGSTES